MAKFVIKIDKQRSMTYFPKEIRREGFAGEIEGLPNARTFTLIRPGTKLVDVKRSPGGNNPGHRVENAVRGAITSAAPVRTSAAARETSYAQPRN
jgi:hypothetical protein